MHKLSYGVLALSLLINLHSAYAQHDGHAPGGELKHGRYIGYITFDDRDEKIAIVADFYVESPEDLRQFPRLNALFKYSFGGHNTHEYYTEIFEDIRYDFDNGVLTLDEMNNDFLMTAEVHTMGSDTYIMGQTFVRSSATSGSLHLKYETDEPGGGDDDEPGGGSDDEPGDDDSRFIPLLDGQYEGACEDKRAAFQIQTRRALASDFDPDALGFNRHYAISGRIAYDDPRMCGDGSGASIWCSYYRFASGTYNPFLGKLTLHGARSSQECDLNQGSLSCQVRMQGRTIACSFQKVDMSIKEPRFYSRRYHVRPTSEQLQELPPANPPGNAELTAALRGTFNGYLHNETNDTYQIVRLNVMPYSSTNNPHNPNQMMVTTTLVSQFGRTGTSFLTQRYEPRSFYLRPGFTLNGPNADAYINVAEWKSGYIRGTFYSHGFGHVGTVQLVKGALPDIPNDAKIVGSFAGEYEGPLASDGSLTRMRWFKLLFPSQPTDVIEHVIHFRGSYQAVIDVTAIKDIELGTFDPYTGTLGWLITRGGDSTFTSGLLNSDGNISMYWPPAPDVFGARAGVYRHETYLRLGN